MPDPEELVVRGWPVLRLTSEQLVADLLPALGGTVLSLRRRSDDLELLWQTPWGLRHLGSAPMPGTAEVTFYGSYPGGWHPVFPNGGDSASAHGAEWGYDGEARTTWLDWTATATGVRLTGRLARSPFELVRDVRLRDGEISVEDTVTNVGGEHVDVMWGQQVALGEALLGPDTVIQAGSTTVRSDPRVAGNAGYDDLLPWPRAYGRNGLVNLRGTGTEPDTRLVYLSDFTDASVTVRRPGVGVELRWDELTWPHLWYALETGADTGFPWYGKGRFLALTPSTSWPAHGLHDARRVGSSLVRILPGSSRSGRLALRLTG